jgi:hypothetical protein
MPTYSELPYDILHQLCTHIREIDFDTLKVFSQVDKRTHSVVVPILFHSISFRQHWRDTDTPWKGVQEVADAILSNKEALAAIRFALPFPKQNHLILTRTTSQANRS